ncbi:MAG TPA: choice-of-anchor Q domain-containing protein [Phototrophicaceae bacterium]|nr:choice-of-anchor Q domain-containing protein [Phototrophicaceae bacterium]
MNRQHSKLILVLLFALLSVTATSLHAQAGAFPAFPARGTLSLPGLNAAPHHSGRAPAGNFTVDTISDSVDANAGDGLCADASASCSLRAAIDEANALDPGSTISIPAGTYVLTVNENPGNILTTLLATQAMTITGAGVGQTIIDGNNISSVIVITGPDVTVEDVTVTGGNGIPGTPTVVGGVYQIALNTVLRNISVEDNHAGDVGGVAILGTATIEDSVITDNQATTGDGEYGTGGIYIASSSVLELTNVTVSDNTSATVVGGIYVDEGQLTMNNSAIINNSAVIAAGGMVNDTGTADLTNVTISGNQANQGGGFYHASATSSLNNVTITDNNAPGGGGGLVFTSGTLNMSNSILALNTSPLAPDCNGGITSTGDNLIGNTADGCTGAAGDLTDVDPLLDPLDVAPGATTATHALQALSPAIDAANDATCASVDQRGVDRPQGASCDIGAYEFVNDLIDNGGFEDPTVDPWVVKNSVGDKIKCDTETKIVAHTGICAFRFKGGVGESTKIQQIIDLTDQTFASGDSLDLSAFFNANKPTTSGKIKVVVAYSDSTAPDKFKGNLTPTSGYEEQIGSVILNGSAVNKIKVMFINKSTAGKAYLDDVSLVLFSASTALPLPVELALPQALPLSVDLANSNILNR